ncbi:cytochrome b-c1 complex subunit 8-like [Ctenocephalides felis]|uniref:cytochrome b-c1 complex subunit 8-like n=1 Tax=Ctenocephalides felis TaxID=7515 RepID=UPI000E6E38E3|nr:cytochrome b-c1 complex subunit 8-like [Ctenocephalides felis]XP_026466105.1 cytochrome b-c1 complex subunit 8-like [Ctenocephalides felis]XP_026466106.1 cytochrome b-c1 complex subunit 8-like [Ctenocephalides felis]XP_026466107.1 cytochrome b-c1 complex subunit 8-like [Ctenocephalides felis]XP_026466108.1 cytochrome b-c1 complex subunit 8-like [Ctenocephalides felis]XP_026467091.1 cytochrome b-c1 complex subunit 8-like [Ctenocephalides felis]XP_026467092.1 cytochrome b-c1 complex subunit 
MGKHFGELYKIRGLVSYTLSPFEQKAFAGLISKGLPNTLRRIRESAFIILPPTIIAYLVYDTVEKKYAQLQRKNPADYENDV